LRGAAVEVDARHAARVVIVLCLTALAAAVVSLFVAGAHKNAEIANLQQHGMPVEVTVTRCFGLLGGSGSNGAGYSCRGTYVLDGKRYSATLPGDTLHAAGSAVRVVTTESDPGLIASFHQVANQHTSWRVFVVPIVLLVVLTASVTAIALRRRKDPGPSAQSAVGSGRGFTGGSPLWGSEGGV
jgi:hypothetical protein